MVIPMLYKNTIKKIKKSFGRYISLFIMVMIGVGFFAGIQSSAPDMVLVADQYYKEHKLMDFKIVSSMGLTESDVTALKALDGVSSVIPSYSLNVLAQDKTLRLHAFENTVNKVKLIDGRMPETENECIADSKNYKIGDKIKISEDVSEELKNNEFTVVGTADSVLYLADDFGSTTNGDGRLSSYVFINRDNFILDAYTEIYLTAQGSKDADAYSVTYDSLSKQLNDELVKIKPDREDARYQEIYSKADDEISENERKLKEEKDKGQKKLDDAKLELDHNNQKLEDGKAELNKNEAELKKNSEKQNREFAAARTKIADGWDKINSALNQYNIRQEELDNKIGELDYALNSMKEQAANLPEDSAESLQLKETINQYTASYQGLMELKGSIDTLTASESELNNGVKTFNSEIKKAEKEIQKGRQEIEENEKKLKEGYDEYNENLDKFNSEMADAKIKLQEARTDLLEIEKPQWYIFDRDAAVGYSDLKSDIDVVSSVAAVFPFFFILLGMLMASNSMTRLIAEERGELGTLTSLGYKDSSIIKTYLFYILSASGLGMVAGFFAGCRIIPPLIYMNFQYILPPLMIRYDSKAFSIILAVTLSLMIVLTLITCRRELNQEPAVLMRPVPLPNGQTIFLEKIRPFWKHLSFTWKVTVRNMFRYKKRAFMTIVGVAGCTSLLLVGFGLRDSMRGIAQKQYGGIFRYGNMMILKEETKNISGDLEEMFVKEQIEKPLLLRQAAFEGISKDKSMDAFLIVPENKELFHRYFQLKSTVDGGISKLKDNGAVITHKLSEVLKAGKGDTLLIMDTDNREYSLSVIDVVENYTSNYIYMSNVQYKKVFGDTLSYNAVVANHNTEEKTLAKHLIDSGLVLNVVFSGDILQKAIDSNDSLNGIIILLVVVASLLAIIVLYNLTSINISERSREIATLKVLGFNDKETNGYIYREAFILTLISIGLGFILGIVLHRFVIAVLEGNEMVMLKKIHLLSYSLAGLLTLIFSVIMQIVTYFKLKTIDMIESLKSVE